MSNKKPGTMFVHGLIVVALMLINQVASMSLTLDEDAQQLCKKYKMMCKSHEVCAVQHFTEPKMTMPVCIPLSFVPVRNLVCRLPPEKGDCYARYIRWHYNIHEQGCVHFQYGGCGGNNNNFMTRDECETACLRTPTIRLIDGGSIKPAVMTAPEYKPPRMNKYEALNSVMMASPEYTNSIDRFQSLNHRINRHKQNNEVSTRKRRRLEKERAAKEKRRRERRKEKRRLRRLKKQQRKMEKKLGLKKKSSGGKRKKNKKKSGAAVINETSLEQDKSEKVDRDVEIVKEAEEIVNKEIEILEEEINKDEEEKRLKKEKRRERKRRKKNERRRKKRRLEKLKKQKRELPKYAEMRGAKESTFYKRFQILDKDEIAPQEESLVRTD